MESHSVPIENNITLLGLFTLTMDSTQDNFTTTAGLPNGTSTAESMSPGEMAAIVILFTITCSFALVGNVAAILVFAKGRRCRSDVNGYLISLAVADLLMAMVCVPFTIAHVLLDEWVFSLPVCKIISWLQLTAMAVSIYTNACISVDRFIAIRFPFHRFTQSRFRTPLVLTTIWVVASGVALVQLVTATLVESAPGSDKYWCIEEWADRSQGDLYFIFLFLMHYVVPVGLLVVMYTLVCRILWSSKKSNVDLRRSLKGSDHQTQNKKKIIKMLMVIILIFLLSWLPQFVFFFDLKFGSFVMSLTRKQADAVYYTTYFLAMSNSFQNPLIYVVMHENFRIDFAETIVNLLPCCLLVKPVRAYLIRKMPRRRNSRRKPTLVDKKISAYAGEESELTRCYSIISRQSPQKFRKSIGRDSSTDSETMLDKRFSTATSDSTPAHQNGAISAVESDTLLEMRCDSQASNI